MITGIGVDIVKIERLKRSVENSGRRFLERVFTEGEIGYCYQRRDPYPSLAARFAAKEAFVKAMGLDERLALKEIEVAAAKNGRPAIRASGRLAGIIKAEGIEAVHLSLSHEKDYAVAMVVVEGERRDTEICNPLSKSGCRIEA